MFTITREWLHRFPQTPPAGWTKRQLALLGVKWPAKQGWLSELIGKQITDTLRTEFESLAGVKSALSEEERSERNELLRRNKRALVAEILELRRATKKSR